MALRPPATSRAPDGQADGSDTNSDVDLPYEQQCILSGGLYTNIGLYCYSIDAFGNQCYDKMTVECIGSQGGIVGCYNYMTKVVGNGSTSQQQPPAATPLANSSSGTAPSAAGDSSGSSGSGGTTPSIVGAVVGGVVGGLVLAAVVAVAAVWLHRRRRRAQPGAAAAGDSDDADKAAGGGAGGVAAAAVVLRLDHGDTGGSGTAALLESAAEAASLVPVTALTPLNADIPLNITTTTINLALVSGGAPGSSSVAGSERVASRRRPGGQSDSAGSSDLCTHAAATPDDVLGHEQQQPAPAQPHVTLLLGQVIGKGSFGKVVEGIYAGRRVAVKLIDTGLLLPAAAAAAQLGKGQPPSQPAAAWAYVSRGDDDPTAADVAAPHIGAASTAGSTEAEVQQGLIAALGQEVEVLARVRHHNIVQLLAANLRPPHVCLVMERMDTSLDRLLYKDPDRPLPLSLALRIALQVARALHYLHPTILHRDLKPANVLISHADDGDECLVVAKLADFGLSRLRSTVLVTCNPEVGTGPYMAPECFGLGNSTIMDRADCYSFGVLLWELIARRRPWEGLSVFAVAVRVAVHGERLPLAPLEQAGAPSKIVRLVWQCFDADPWRRPAAAEIVKSILLVQEELRMRSEAGLAEMLGLSGTASV
eukprot:XP_001699317.1 predicted protein [Chlamydomonas reinhardtii]